LPKALFRKLVSAISLNITTYVNISLVVSELSALFENLRTSPQTAVRPTQRLANAVLLKISELLPSKEKIDTPSTAKPEALPKPPPLPARPSPAPPVTTEHIEDVDMVTAKDNSDAAETASNRSSQTLVDDRDVDSDKSYEKVEKAGFVTNLMPTVSSKVSDASSAGPKLWSNGATEPSDTMKVENGDGDITMLDGNLDEKRPPDVVDEKTVLEALMHQKRSSGTDQQDVQEVMGRIMDRMQAAIKPDRELPGSGVQMEMIMETFSVTLATYSKKADEPHYTTNLTLERLINAYPAKSGPCTLYDALDGYFDLEEIDKGQYAQFSGIRELPPVLHILIQRTQGVNNKNTNPVIIEDMLYLDRYMDAEFRSDLMKKRHNGWQLKRFLESAKAGAIDSSPEADHFLDSFVNALPNDVQTQTTPGEDTPMTDAGANPPNNDMETFESLYDYQPVSTLEFDGAADADEIVTKQRDLTSEGLGEWQEVGRLGPDFLAQDYSNRISAIREAEIRTRGAQLEDLFSDMKQQAYRLHAVICHSGQLNAGHYWIWIRDFEANVWRKYNDRQILEEPSTDKVLGALNKSGEPYYLCYVRDERVSDFVDCPKREPVQKEEPTQEQPSRASSQTMGRQDSPVQPTFAQEPMELTTNGNTQANGMVNGAVDGMVSGVDVKADDILPSYDESQQSQGVGTTDQPT
jgi:ubiquitin carboxyl-terminal hydrolase 25